MTDLRTLTKAQKHLLVGRLIPISEFFPADQKMVNCPFHQDDTPSAKIYDQDDDGIIRLFCFGCQRQFTSYDYLEKIEGVDPIQAVLIKFRKEDVEIVAAQIVKQKPRVERDFTDLVGAYKASGDLETFLSQIYKAIEL